MNNCTICFEQYKKNRVECYCGIHFCKDCLKVYLLSKNELVIKCMSSDCNLQYDNEFLANNLDKKFLTITFKKHQQESLFIHENSFTIYTQDEILKQDEINKLKEKIYNIKENKIKIQQNIKCSSSSCTGFINSLKCDIC